MDTKIKNRIISVSFIFILGAMMIINILSPDKEISYEERRKLSTFPKFKVEDILNGDYFEQMEEYFLDQFYLRENFRKVKAFVNNKIFKEKDNNNIYIVDDGIYKMEYVECKPACGLDCDCGFVFDCSAAYSCEKRKTPDGPGRNADSSVLPY